MDYEKDQDVSDSGMHEIQSSEPPRYEHYQMHRHSGRMEQKSPVKPKKKNNPGKKIAETIALAVVFGITASAVFQCSNTVAEKYFRKETEAVQLSDGSAEQTGQTAAPSGEASTTAGSVAEVAESAMPEVVAITSVSIQEIPSFFGAYGFSPYGTVEQFSSESSGSGIIVGENEDEFLIATNNHVVEGATTLSVCFIGDDVANAEAETRDLASGDINVEDAVSAKIKGTDKGNDLAVIAVQKSDIPEDTRSEIKVAQIGDSDGLQVGEQVVAIGNALGYGQSVTSGWVSTLDRSISSEDGTTTTGLIQTDAAINPGNSGGALLNMKGELIGINSAKYAADAVEGMGYAIPISTASPILEKLMNRQTRDKLDVSESGYLGISGGDLTTEAVQMFGVPAGAFVRDVDEGDAAERAGLQKGDVIVELDGQPVTGSDDLAEKLSYYAAGETVEMVIARAVNGEYVEQTMEVTLDARPSSGY